MTPPLQEPDASNSTDDVLSLSQVSLSVSLDSPIPSLVRILLILSVTATGAHERGRRGLRSGAVPLRAVLRSQLHSPEPRWRGPLCAAAERLRAPRGDPRLWRAQSSHQLYVDSLYTNTSGDTKGKKMIY
jgi:hypothetical protein